MIVIVFNLAARDYFSPQASLVMYMQLLKADGTAVVKEDVATVETFWERYFTSIKVKKHGDVNVININSGDVMTQFNLYMDGKAKGYAEWDKDMLTTSKRYTGINGKSKRDNTVATDTNDSIKQRILLFNDKLVKANARFVIPLKALCNFFNIKGPLPLECSFYQRIDHKPECGGTIRCDY